MSLNYKNFHINKCRHYPTGINFDTTTSNTNSCSAFFDENCLYQIEGENNSDVNKLWGFPSAIHHQIQSARLGWRCQDGENIEILTYCYKDSAINFDELHVIDTIKPNDILNCTLINTRFEYIFQYSRDNYSIEQTVSKSSDCFPIHYYLFPYFGGNETAPHDMDIYLKYY